MLKELNVLQPCTHWLNHYGNKGIITPLIFLFFFLKKIKNPVYSGKEGVKNEKTFIANYFGSFDTSGISRTFECKCRPFNDCVLDRSKKNNFKRDNYYPSFFNNFRKSPEIIVEYHLF